MSLDTSAAMAAAKAFSASKARGPVAAPDQGEVLARVSRPDGTEMRVSSHLYEGKPYVRVGPWQRGEGDSWWPVKSKGTTVKVRELGDVVVGLLTAMESAK
jgi:hypothetical protein